MAPSISSPLIPATTEVAPTTESPGVRLRLDDAIAYALANNPRLRVARAAIEKARGREQAAFAPFLPQVDFMTRIGAVNRNLGAGAPGLTGDILTTNDKARDYAQAELELQWTLYDFGRTSSAHDKAVVMEQVAAMQWTRAQETVVYDVVNAYALGLLTEALRIISEDAIRRAEATLKDTLSRRAAGVADRDDVLRADVQLSEAREGLVLAREEELAAQAKLNNAMGRAANWPVELVDERPEPTPAPSLVQCLEMAADLRPEIGVARGMVAASQHGRAAAAADFKPKLYMLGSVGYVNGENVHSGFQEGTGLHLNQSLYAGGRRQGDLRAAEADVAGARATAQVVLDGITLEVTLAHRGLTSARERIGLSEPAVAEAEENLRLVRSKYRNGNATPTDIVDAETTLTRAQQRHAAAKYQYLAALARLDYALGTIQPR